MNRHVANSLRAKQLEMERDVFQSDFNTAKSALGQLSRQETILTKLGFDYVGRNAFVPRVSGIYKQRVVDELERQLNDAGQALARANMEVSLDKVEDDIEQKRDDLDELMRQRRERPNLALDRQIEIIEKELDVLEEYLRGRRPNSWLLTRCL